MSNKEHIEVDDITLMMLQHLIDFLTGSDFQSSSKSKPTKMSDVPDWYSDILPELQKLPADIFLKLPSNVSDKTIFKDHLNSILSELNHIKNGTANNVQTELDTLPEETVLLPSNELS